MEQEQAVVTAQPSTARKGREPWFGYAINDVRRASQYSREIKAKAVMLAVRDGVDYAIVAERLGIGAPQTVGCWVRQWREERRANMKKAREARLAKRAAVTKAAELPKVTKHVPDYSASVEDKLATVTRERDFLLRIVERSGITLSVRDAIVLMQIKAGA